MLELKVLGTRERLLQNVADVPALRKRKERNRTCYLVIKFYSNIIAQEERERERERAAKG